MPESVASLAKHYWTGYSGWVRGAVANAVLPLAVLLDRRNRIVPRTMSASSQKTLTAAQANERISRALDSGKPYLVSRFGRSELLVALQQMREDEWPLIRRLASSVVTGERLVSRSSDHYHLWMSGFYPYWDRHSLLLFSKSIREASKKIDLLGSWVKGENLVPELASNVLTTELPSIEPFHVESPWTLKLEGKRVLVVHPFSASIQSQFRRRKNLHQAPMVLPDFHLETIAPPVTRVSPSEIPLVPEASWFTNLRHLEDEICLREFDVALVGSGSYGMPISAFIRDLGKVAINLGGATQLLFGIWGNRWNGSKRFEVLRNERWVRPRKSEVPKNALQVEGGAYW